MSQKFGFGIAESLMAEKAGVSLKSLHFDLEAMIKTAEAVKPLAAELGVPAPDPHIAGFGYPHVAALGAPVEFPEDGEPNVFPIIKTPADIDNLKEPDDYLAAPLIQTRLSLVAELGRRNKNWASQRIGHPMEGPVTTAVLLMGDDFLMLPYDDPKRAHRLLEFCTESALHYIQALHRHFNGDVPMAPGPGGIPDDFAGMLPPDMFDEFVIHYWDSFYTGMQSTSRGLHSELLREAHLPFLKSAKIDRFDPGADQYLTPELLSRKCPCPFQTLIKSWEINDMNSDQLENYYRDIAKCKPFHIRFVLDRMENLDKIKRLLKVARELA